ncbi:MAG TPA: serine/threonine-protein kinase [Kofleriaceae bacterium]|jgi:tetratricopeptide (TPR) repeat protein
MAAGKDDEAEFSTLDMGMAERPASDPIAMERARARTERAVFGASRPARLGRYEIAEPIAGGGMGLVYAAHDPELDRRVALKVLHPGRLHGHDAHDRLLQEARALAQLDHQNVVKIHDVLSADGEIVVVMALLEGVTLGAWEEASQRDWRAVITAYAQAGDGLAAAHSLGIIHRDFKPANAIISSTGHVRVLDFGLARLTLSPDAPAPPAALLPEGLTVTGAFLGTLAYAAPEQLAGEEATAASDQFSFCVALHCAIEGVRPFGGKNLGEIATSIERDAVGVATDGRRIPAWLRRTLRRGLSADPAQRFPSIQALLDELRRPRGVQRWKWPLVTALVGLSAIATTAWARAGGKPECDGDAARVASVWGAEARAAVADRFDLLPTAFAGELERRVLDGLDGYARRWRDTHRDACIAHRSGAESDRLLDRQMRCLARHLDDLAAAIQVLSRTDAAHAAAAMDVVVGIPDVAVCENLASDTEPPDVAVAREVARITNELSQATALEHGGRSEEALVIANRDSAAADATGYSPLVADVDLELGRILIGRGQLDDATTALLASRRAALVTGTMTSVAVEAGARLIYTEGAQTPDLDRMQRDLAILEPMSEQLAGDHFVRALLFNNVGQIYRNARQSAAARAYLERAHAAAGADPAIELIAIDQTLATLVDDPAVRIALHQGACDRTQRVLGAHHLMALSACAELATAQAEPVQARRRLAPICDEYRQAHPDLADTIADCELVLAYVDDAAGATADARRAYEAVVAASQLATASAVVRRRLAEAELALLAGDLAAAEAGFLFVVAEAEPSPDWWIRAPAYQAELQLGHIALAQKRTADAIAHLTVAATGYADIARANPAIMYIRRAEEARQLLGNIPEQQARGRHE